MTTLDIPLQARHAARIAAMCGALLLGLSCSAEPWPIPPPLPGQQEVCTQRFHMVEDLAIGVWRWCIRAPVGAIQMSLGGQGDFWEQAHWALSLDWPPGKAYWRSVAEAAARAGSDKDALNAAWRELVSRRVFITGGNPNHFDPDKRPGEIRDPYVERLNAVRYKDFRKDCRLTGTRDGVEIYDDPAVNPSAPGSSYGTRACTASAWVLVPAALYVVDVGEGNGRETILSCPLNGTGRCEGYTRVGNFKVFLGIGPAHRENLRAVVNDVRRWLLEHQTQPVLKAFACQAPWLSWLTPWRAGQLKTRTGACGWRTTFERGETRIVF